MASLSPHMAQDRKITVDSPEDSEDTSTNNDVHKEPLQVGFQMLTFTTTA